MAIDPATNDVYVVGWNDDEVLTGFSSGVAVAIEGDVTVADTSDDGLIAVCLPELLETFRAGDDGGFRGMCNARCSVRWSDC